MGKKKSGSNTTVHRPDNKTPQLTEHKTQINLLLNKMDADTLCIGGGRKL
jgi:hypothetical protein